MATSEVSNQVIEDGLLYNYDLVFTICKKFLAERDFGEVEATESVSAHAYL